MTTYSLGLRLEDTLSLQVGDVDAGRKRVHVRRGKGHKDLLIQLPDLTLQGLRELWRKHRHPDLLFPNGKGSLKTIQQATTHMDRGGTQNVMKRVVAECGIKKSIDSFPSTQLRHPSFRTRSEPPAYPGTAWPCQPYDHSPLYPSL